MQENNESLIGRNISSSGPSDLNQSQAGDTVEQLRKKKLQQQRARAEKHWGRKIEGSNVDTMLDLMFSHMSDPQKSPDPRQDPNGTTRR